VETIGRFFRAPADSFFLFGPRGTGKSTWLRQNLPEAPVIDLLDPETHRAYSARPEMLRELVAGNPQARDFVIDEVQRAPQLLTVVHQLIEEDRSRRFVLTGSSSRKLKRSGVDLLAGRALQLTLHPFMAAELGERFNLEDSLRLGTIPLVLGASDPRKTLSAYVSLYLREEVQGEGLVRNVGDFARFLEVISFSHGAQLNSSAVARECGVGRKTVEGHISILEDLLLGFTVPVFAKRAQRLLVQHPKFYFADAGVYASLRPAGPLDSPDAIGGSALEGLVAQHLRAYLAYGSPECELFFWRTRAGTEVDFVVYGPDTLLALEVKASATIHSKDVRPLRTFQEDYPQARVCLLYGGRERLGVSGIPCVPVGEFLRNLVPGSPVPVD
jgi:predicted AAA+ superfamily ATPase